MGIMNKVSAKLWILLGVGFVLFGFVLAHLSNAGFIHWSNGLEHVASWIFHGGGPLLIFIGIVSLALKLRK